MNKKQKEIIKEFIRFVEIELKHPLGLKAYQSIEINNFSKKILKKEWKFL